MYDFRSEDHIPKKKYDIFEAEQNRLHLINNTNTEHVVFSPDKAYAFIYIYICMCNK